MTTSGIWLKKWKAVLWIDEKLCLVSVACEKVSGVSVACDCHQSRPSHMSHHNGDTQAWISPSWHAPADNYRFRNSYIFMPCKLTLVFFKAFLSKRGFDLALGFQRSGIFSRNFDRTPFRFNRDWLLNFGMRLTVGCMEIRCFLDLSLNNWTFYPGDSFQGTRRSSKI